MLRRCASIVIGLVALTLIASGATDSTRAADATDPVAAQDAPLTDSVFIYRGMLAFHDVPFNGVVDLEFRLYAGDRDVTPIGPAVVADQWPVVDGVVVVGLEFGVDVDVDLKAGAWMEVEVDGVILSPRRYVAPPGWSLSGDVTRGDRRRAGVVFDSDSTLHDVSNDDDTTSMTDESDTESSDPAVKDAVRSREGGRSIDGRGPSASSDTRRENNSITRRGDGSLSGEGALGGGLRRRSS